MLRATFFVLATLVLLSPTALAAKHKVKKGQTIQSVIDAAAPGDTVIVPKGVYVEVLLIPAGKPGLRLLGKGAVLDARPAGASGSGAGLTVTANDVTVSGFEIRHALGGSNPVGGNTAGYGLYAEGARLTIRDLVVRSCSTGGVRVTGADALVEQLLVQRVEGDGVRVSGVNAVVRHATVERALGVGILVFGDDLLATQCDVSYASLGIVVDGNGDLEISKCRVSHVQQEALLCLGGQNVRVVDNKVDHAGVGLNASGLAVHLEGNQLSDLHLAGLVASGASMTLLKNSVSRVNMNGNGTGIELQAGSVAVSSNHVTDVGGRGMAISTEEGGTVEGNRVQRCGTVGLAAALTLVGDALQASKNKVLDSRGIAVVIVSDDGLFENNLIQGGLSTGIRVEPSASQLTLRKNKVANVFGEGIQNFGDATVIQGNKVSKTRTSLTNDSDAGASLVDLGGNKLGKGASAAGAPQPEILE